MKKTQVMIGFLQKQEFCRLRFSSRCRQLVCAACALVMVGTALKAKDTFEPYASDVPKSAVALWGDYDPRHEPLDIEVVQEWENEGVITRYVTFTVGTFKGKKSRIAGYYCLPAGKTKLPAFVWAHGGGQRADRHRGEYFARQGYASIDINWLGRPLEDGIDINTDWGNVDPTQGPRFYSKALRQGWKRSLLPDEYTIDTVSSPRNSNWFLLAVAARRGITFLEQQPEVNADRIGLSGFSMGGMITALTAIDSRLKAVVPFVGGTGFKYVDFPGGIEGSSIRGHFQNLELYKSTIDARAYWPFVRCPVCFISSTNDFHSVFDRIYRSMALVPHSDWRVSTNPHQNHGPGPEQWAMLNIWFDQYLKGVDQHIPVTPPSTFSVSNGIASFAVTPEDQDRLVATEIYFSYDPNPRTRFWERAQTRQDEQALSARVPVFEDLPLYVFALCRYKLGHVQTLERGETSTYTLNSVEHSFVPEKVNLESLVSLASPHEPVDDFENGFDNWASRDQQTIKTYKFQSPRLDRKKTKKLAIVVNPFGKKLNVRLRTDSGFLSRPNNIGSFSAGKTVEGQGPQTIILRREDFKGPEGKELEWSKIATFEITVFDAANNQKIALMADNGEKVLQLIELRD
jgi:dienelactone hydrolase